MEEKTGCVHRDLQNRKAMRSIVSAAKDLEQHSDSGVKDLAKTILAAARLLEE